MAEGVFKQPRYLEVTIDTDITSEARPGMVLHVKNTDSSAHTITYNTSDTASLPAGYTAIFFYINSAWAFMGAFGSNGLYGGSVFLSVDSDTDLTSTTVAGTIYKIKNTDSSLHKITYNTSDAIYLNQDEAATIIYDGTGWFVEDYKLQSYRVVSILTSMTDAERQAIIDAQPKNTNGYNLLFQFEDGTHSIGEEILIKGFYGGGVVRVYGNQSDSGESSGKSVVLDITTVNGKLFTAYYNQVETYFEYFEVTTSTTYNTGVSNFILFDNCSWGGFFNCYINDSGFNNNIDMRFISTVAGVGGSTLGNFSDAVLSRNAANVYIFDSIVFGSNSNDLTANVGGVVSYTGNISTDSVTTNAASGGRIYDETGLIAP